MTHKRDLIIPRLSRCKKNDKRSLLPQANPPEDSGDDEDLNPRLDTLGQRPDRCRADHGATGRHSGDRAHAGLGDRSGDSASATRTGPTSRWEAPWTQDVSRALDD